MGEDDHAVTLRPWQPHPDAADRPARATAPAAHTVLGWHVADIRAAMCAIWRPRACISRVYDGFGQDADGVWAAPGGGAKVAWFTDPDGNVLSLTQFG